MTIQFIATSRLHKLSERRNNMCQKLFFEMQIPSHRLHHLLQLERNFTSTRNSKKYELPKCRTNRYKDSLSPIAFLIFSDFVIYMSSL